MSVPSIDPRKTALVGEFLKEAFPGDHVYDAEDFDSDSHFYRIEQGDTGAFRHDVYVSREFLGFRDPPGQSRPSAGRDLPHSFRDFWDALPFWLPIEFQNHNSAPPRCGEPVAGVFDHQCLPFGPTDAMSGCETKRLDGDRGTILGRNP